MEIIVGISVVVFVCVTILFFSKLKNKKIINYKIIFIVLSVILSIILYSIVYGFFTSVKWWVLWKNLEDNLFNAVESNISEDSVSNINNISDNGVNTNDGNDKSDSKDDLLTWLCWLVVGSISAFLIGYFFGDHIINVLSDWYNYIRSSVVASNDSGYTQEEILDLKKFMKDNPKFMQSVSRLPVSDQEKVKHVIRAWRIVREIKESGGSSNK